MKNKILVDEIKKLYNEGEKISVGCSLGKDSIALLIWCEKNLKSSNIEYTVHCAHSPTDWNDLKEYQKYLEGEFNLKIYSEDSIFTRDQFLERLLKGANRSGLPFFNRYCQGLVKGMSLKKIKSKITLEGIRWDESSIRNKYDIIIKRGDTTVFRPIIDYSEADVYNAVRDRGIKLHWNYKYFNRLSCAMCIMPLINNVPLFGAKVIAFKNKFDYDLYSKWFDEIVKNGKPTGDKTGGTLERHYNSFCKAWKFLKENSENVEKKEKENIYNVDFWYAN